MNDKFNFLPALFGTESISNTKQQLAYLLVKYTKLAYPNPTTMAESNWKSPILVHGHSVAALHERTDFRSADHASIMA